jgi:hypothetical protein
MDDFSRELLNTLEEMNGRSSSDVLERETARGVHE